MISGGAQGIDIMAAETDIMAVETDIMAAETVMDLQKRYPNVTLEIAVPLKIRQRNGLTDTRRNCSDALTRQICTSVSQ